MEDIFGKGYNKNERPVVHDKEKVTVYIGLSLNQIMDVVRNRRRHMFTTTKQQRGGTGLSITWSKLEASQAPFTLHSID